MTTLANILTSLEEIAPLRTAEAWDNVGLLVGDPTRNITKILCCLTITKSTLEEAIEDQAELIVTHHPIPFKPLSRITTESSTGRLLLHAIEHRIAIYSPHTAWDNCLTGINAQLAALLGLEQIGPLAPFPANIRAPIDSGTGRFGVLPIPAAIESIATILKKALPNSQFRHTHDRNRNVQKIGIVCGSGGSMLHLAKQTGCDAMLTGEATYHQCLDAEANDIALLMVGHFASESFAMQKLAIQLSSLHPEITSKASQHECSLF